MAKKSNRQFNENDFQSAQQELVKEIAAVTGDDQRRPRFPRFKVMDDLKTMIAQALNDYKRGLIHQATETLQGALKSLEWRQLQYVKKAAEKNFCGRLEGLQKTGLDSDLVKYVQKRIDALNHFARDDKFDLGQASELFYQVEEALESARTQQEGRNHKRLEAVRSREALSELQKREEEIARTRAAQAEHNRREQERREESVKDFAAQLDALCGFSLEPEVADTAA